MPEDRAVVAMWQEEQSLRCSECGTFDWEQEEDSSAWEAGLHLCVFCASVEKLRDHAARDREGLPSEGFKVRLYRGSDNGD